jgi:hypothetical protein
MNPEARSSFLQEKCIAMEAKGKVKEHCDLCDKSFSCMSSYHKHVKTFHADNEDLRQSIEKKISAHNTSNVVLQCPLCNEERNGKAIFRHFKEIHGQDSRYEILLLELQKNHKKQSLIHEKIRYQMEQVGKTAECKFCGREFPQRWARNRHQRKCAQNPNPLKLHHCTICNKAYTTKEKLEQHKKGTAPTY